MTHTLTPLRMGEYEPAEDREDLDCQLINEGAHAGSICVYGRGDELKARAAYIAKAVNAHAELVEALQAMMVGWQLHADGKWDCRQMPSAEAGHLARAVLTKVGAA